MASVSGQSGPTTIDSIENDIAALGDKKRMGDAFERVVLHHLRHDPIAGLARVWTWADWPNRLELGLKSDQGVDLVALDGEGKRVAVQVKFHTDPDRDVTQREVATLFSLRPDLFDPWFIVSNSIGHSPAAERATLGRGDVTWLHRDDLVSSPIDWSDAVDAVSGAAEPLVEPASPRDPEQTAAIADTLAALQEHERAQLVMACGTGKTLVTRWVSEARDDRLVLVLVPTLLLLKQFRTVWREHARQDFVDLGVCSDADVMGRDEWTLHADELGVRVTTDPADIAVFLKGDGRRVVFGTYASSARIAEAPLDRSVPAFDLVVADEAHRVAGITSRGSAGERDQRVVLDGDRIRARRRLFATATPRVYRPSARGPLAEREDVAFASMDDPEVFGAEAHKLWFREAVELGRLVDYRLSVVVVTDAEVERLVREREVVDVGGRTFDAETLASLVALRRAVTELGLNRVISFHHTIKRAQDFARELERLELDAPSVAAHHISGAMSMADRQRVLARLREPEQPTVVTNARCLTEGIDVPSLDAVAFVDPRSSPVDIVQAVGRVMRTAPGKALGNVIVPVFLTAEALADPETAIESSAFAPVLAVLRALRAHDPELVSDATRIATSLGERDAVVGGHISEHIQLLGREVDIESFQRAVETRFVEVSADRWEIGLEHLRRFAEREGHPLVPARHREHGYRLGQWVNYVRLEYKDGVLGHRRMAILDNQPGWVWNAHSAAFDQGLADLDVYVREHGHSAPPSEFIAPSGARLGRWVVKQRALMHAGKLPASRASALAKLPGWVWDTGEESYRTGFKALESYVARNGHSTVPRSYEGGGVRLGRWVDERRNEYRRGVLQEERRSALEGLEGWSWSPRADSFPKGLDELLEYVTAHGDMPPRGYWSPGGYPVGEWFNNIRQLYRKGALAAERRTELESVPGWTPNPHERQWDEAYRALNDFVAREGHASVPQRHIEAGMRLGAWVAKQRTHWKNGTLSPDRADRLAAVQGWRWNPRPPSA